MSAGYVWREHQNGYVIDRSKAPVDFRLEDLQVWNILLARCGACKHLGEIYPTSLERRFRGHERLVKLQSGLKCGRCDNRGTNTWQVYRIGRNR